MTTLVLLRALLVAVLIFLNAFFVAAEFALVSVRDTRIQQLIEAGRIGARTVQKLHRNIDGVLNAVQFGITIASLGLGWAGEPFVAHLLEGVIGNLPYGRVLSFTFAFILITYLHVILGEVVPKSVALQRPERVALAVAAPMDVFMTLVKPFLVVMSGSARLVLRLFGSPRMGEGSQHSPEEIRLIATASRRVGLLPEQQEEMLHRVLDLSDVLVREIMVPRTRIFSLSADITLEEAMSKVVEEQHSRVPVFEGSIDVIVGVLYTKDLLPYVATGLPADFDLRANLHPPYFVPESKRADALLQEFQAKKLHMAIVVDEYGGTAGLVALEDLLEELVGEIADEYDEPERLIQRLDGSTFRVSGKLPVDDLNTATGLRISNEAYDTVGGWVLDLFGRVPRKSERRETPELIVTVEKVERTRVVEVLIALRKPVSTEAAA